MSQVQVPFKKYIDPRLNLNKEQQFSSAQTAQLITTTSFRPNGATIGSAVGFSCNPPNRNTVVSRNVIKRATFEVKFDKTTAEGANILSADKFKHGPAYMPISRITLNEDMVIGTANPTQANANIVRETFSRYDCDTEYSSSSNMNDTYRRFENVVNSNRSALAPYTDSSTQFGEINSRASLWSYEGTNGNGLYVSPDSLTAPTDGKGNVSRSYTLRFTVDEPLFLSPFVFGKDSENAMGLFGVESLQYNCSFGVKNLAWNSILDNTVYTNVSVDIVDFNLRFKYLHPPVNMSIPRNALYSYYEPQVRTNGVITLADGERSSEQFIVSQLSGIPRRMYVCMRDVDATGTKPLRHLRLVDGSFELRINGQNTLTGQNNKQIYDMSVRNGLKMTYSQFQTYCGAVLCVDFGNGDASLMASQVAGLNQKNEFTISAQYDNQLGEEVKCQYTVIWVYDGIFRMDDGATSKTINPLRESNVLNTAPVKNLHMDNTPDNVYGGSLWSGLTSAGKDILQCALEKRALSKAVKEAGYGGEGVSRDIEDYAVSKMGSGLEPMDRGGRLMSRGMLKRRY